MQVAFLAFFAFLDFLPCISAAAVNFTLSPSKNDPKWASCEKNRKIFRSQFSLVMCMCSVQLWGDPPPKKFPVLYTGYIYVLYVVAINFSYLKTTNCKNQFCSTNFLLFYAVNFFCGAKGLLLCMCSFSRGIPPSFPSPIQLPPSPICR